MDSRLLDLLVCPLCKGPLHYRKAADELICKADRLAFPIREGIPAMLIDQARKLDPLEEVNDP
jgi:tetraacyldisaccharide 4'-kinase